MATQAAAIASHAGTRDRINAALVKASDPAVSDAERNAILGAWSNAVDLLPDIEQRIAFAEAALTYAARLPAPASETLRRVAQAKMTKLKSGAA